MTVPLPLPPFAPGEEAALLSTVAGDRIPERPLHEGDHLLTLAV